MAEPVVQATAYSVCCIPEGIDYELFAIRVEYVGRDRWAVRLRGKRCLGSDGEWDWEPIPSERSDEWLAAHHFDLDTALRLAKEQAPLVTVNGWTVHDVLDQMNEEEW